VAGTNERPQHFLYEDDGAVAFLDSYPRAYGYTLVAPKEHREQLTADFTMEKYLDLQRLVYRVTEAVLLLGEPGYYSRFGFERASDYGLGNEYGVDEYFMLIELRSGALDGSRGTVRYRPEFGQLDA
jgi:predicted N-acetyltransferase YhbS